MKYGYVSINAQNHVRQWFSRSVAETAPGCSITPLAAPQEIIPLSYDMTDPISPLQTSRWTFQGGVVVTEPIP